MKDKLDVVDGKTGHCKENKADEDMVQQGSIVGCICHHLEEHSNLFCQCDSSHHSSASYSH